MCTPEQDASTADDKEGNDAKQGGIGSFVGESNYQECEEEPDEEPRMRGIEIESKGAAGSGDDLKTAHGRSRGAYLLQRCLMRAMRLKEPKRGMRLKETTRRQFGREMEMIWR